MVQQVTRKSMVIRPSGRSTKLYIYTDAFSYTNEEYWEQVKQEIEKL